MSTGTLGAGARVARFSPVYFGAGKGGDFQSVGSSVWSASVDENSCSVDGDRYLSVILEQCKIRVEMADKQ